MQVRWKLALRLALLTVAAATILTSCGEKIVEPVGTEVTVQVVDTQGNSVNGQGAFQTGIGSWESLAPQSTGTFVFSVPDDMSRYGFAVNCPSGLQASSTKALVYQLTVEEVTEVRATCPGSFVGPATTIEGNYDATAIGAADSVVVYSVLDSESGAAATPSGTYGPLTVPAGSGQSFVAVAEDASGDAVAVKVFRDLNLTTATNLNVTFAAGDAVGSSTTPDFSATVPAGWGPEQLLAFVAPNNQDVSLESASNAAATIMPTVPNSQAGDLYLGSSSAIEAVAPNRTVATLQFQSSPATMDFDLPTPWTVAPSATTSALPTFSGLTDLPNEANFRGHLLLYIWDGIPGITGSPSLGANGLIRVFTSTGWLGGSESYAMPDLTGVSGFQGAMPLSGENAIWVVASIASNLATEALLTGSAFPFQFSSGIYTPMFPPIVDGVVTRFALVQNNHTVP